MDQISDLTNEIFHERITPIFHKILSILDLNEGLNEEALWTYRKSRIELLKSFSHCLTGRSATSIS
jgi:hypothetical protein